MTGSVSGTEFVIVGAGGLGGPIALALADAGAGALRIYDHDQVELSNLQRQVQFGTADIGRPKVHVLADRLAERGLRVTAVDRRFDTNEAESLAAEPNQVFIDASDDVPTKFLTSDTACRLGAGFVIAGVTGYRGQIVAGRSSGGGCYRCLFESPVAGDGALSCENAGVFGAAVAVVAGRAAKLAKLVALYGSDSFGLHTWDDLSTDNEPRHVQFGSRPNCPSCIAAPNPILVGEHASADARTNS